MNKTTNLSLKKPEGNDYVNIGDLNDNMDILDEKIGCIQRTVTVTLLAANWSETAPFAQTVEIPGIKETDKTQMISAVTKETPAATAKSWEKMAGMIKAGETLDGQAVFYCLQKKPTEDFDIKLLGVSANG